jgi:Ser/Thr protein kinase RdoA (MazF antagonist)
MTLGLMKSVVATLNEWRSPIADEILSRWEHDEGTAKYFRASANFVFIFKKANRDYILRFNSAGERSLNQIRAESEYLNFLAGEGVRVAVPILSLSGNYVETVQTSYGLFHGAVFEAVSGKQFNIDDLTPELCARWGKALGELHQAAQKYQRKGRPNWSKRLDQLLEYLPKDEKAARESFYQVEKKLSSLPINAQNFGLIHFDFELDNIIWRENRPWIIDFDDCAWYWFAADIAFALRDLFDDGTSVDLSSDSFFAFIYGYRSVRSIDQQEIEIIPVFLRMHNLISFARILQSVDRCDAVDEPEWAAELRKKLCGKLEHYRAGFQKALK